MAYKLSNGSLEIILNGGVYEKPVLQVLGSKAAANNKFRLLLSDGKHLHNFAVLAMHSNDKLIIGELSDYSVIQIHKFLIISSKNIGNGDGKIMVIIAITIIAQGKEVGKMLGNPQSLMEDSTFATSASRPSTPALKANQTLTNTLHTPSASSNLNSSLIGSQLIVPIADLRPYQNKWVIKARVMNKSVKKTNIFFNMDLCDESGEIRATAFRNECEKFYNLIQIDKVYYISHCQIKIANKQYNILKNDYEINLKAETVVVECMDDCSTIPTVKYDFVPIDNIANKSPDIILDTIGVCKAASDLKEIPGKTGKLFKIREVTLVDQSRATITLTLWNNEAESFDASTNPIIAVKGARLAEFNGSKSLSCLGSTILRTNPELPDAHRLRGWYDQGGASVELVNISARRAGGVSLSDSGEWLTLAEAETQTLSSGKKDNYYNLLGVLTLIFADNVVYKSCPQVQCLKKLVDQENGLFLCEKCNRKYSNYQHRLILKANLSDPTGGQKITAFNEVAEVMLGKSANEVGHMLDHDKNGYAQLFDELNFKTFMFRLKSKIGNYSNEEPLDTTVISIQPINYKVANARFIKSIQALSGIEV